MSIPNEYHDICLMLLEATNTGRVAWRERKPGGISVSLPDFYLEIWSGTDEVSAKVFVAMGLRDQKSMKIIDNWFVEEGDYDFNLMDAIYKTARRQISRVADKLKTLRELLESNKKIGLEEDEAPF